MNAAAPEETSTDVIIVGAGLSGIGAAVHLQKHCPDHRYLILESRERIGGTWDLFRYPGIRSDSDMHTLGYAFKPWTNPKAIADGPAIREYIKATAREHDIESHIRYGHRVVDLAWSSQSAVWTITTTDADGNGRQLFKARFVLMCAGYYSYQRAHTPDFPGMEHFQGRIIHPQFWPEDLDYANKQVVVIGSGATAVTLVPAMADAAASVTMLQRSPSYVVARPERDRIANGLRRLLPASWAYGITRWKNILIQQWFYQWARRSPSKVAGLLLDQVRKALPDGYDVSTHFTPRYKPWDERLCAVPDSDLFKAISNGSARVVTDQIESFTKDGIRLRSGALLTADIVITATGLELATLGESSLHIDGELIDPADTYTYKGVMFSGIPNLVSIFGYINASWTLRADLTAEFSCRLLKALKHRGAASVTPTLRQQDLNMVPKNWIVDFTPGYFKRVMHKLPKQGDCDPWLNTQDYRRDRSLFRKAPLDDGALIFTPLESVGGTQAHVDPEHAG
ncbi:MAG: NAD(P)/FAD-dependent oxidoreductase [Pseudomonadota bacterium]